MYNKVNHLFSAISLKDSNGAKKYFPTLYMNNRMPYTSHNMLKFNSARKFKPKLKPVAWQYIKLFGATLYINLFIFYTHTHTP